MLTPITFLQLVNHVVTKAREQTMTMLLMERLVTKLKAERQVTKKEIEELEALVHGLSCELTDIEHHARLLGKPK